MPGREYISFQLKPFLFIFSRHAATHSRPSEKQSQNKFRRPQTNNMKENENG